MNTRSFIEVSLSAAERPLDQTTEARPHVAKTALPSTVASQRSAALSELAATGFLRACEAALGKGSVQHDTDVKSTGAQARRVPGMVSVTTLEDVQTVVRLATEHSVAIAPISTGKNWGFGGAAPVRSGTCIVSLRSMNRIREINTEFGYAVVEPGVTQGELASALRERGAAWALDVTGAGPDTSLIGNAMERGIAYHSQRTQTTRALEVVLADGSVITTGFQDPRVRVLNSLYSHGVGPDPTGLFYQSRFGIVTAMTIDLMPVAKTQLSLSLNVRREGVPSLIEIVRELRHDGALEGVPHIANRARLFSTLGPLIMRRWKTPVTREQAMKILRQVFPQEWNMLTTVRGPRRLAATKMSVLKAALKPLGRVLVMTPLMLFLRRLAGLVIPSIKSVLIAAESVEQLPLGVPSADPQHFLDFDLPEGKSDARLDDHSRGFVYLVPLMPGNAATIERFMASIDDLAKSSGQAPAVTLNPLDARVVEAVVSLTFDKSKPGEAERVLALGKAWLAALRDIGAHPYRAHIDHMDQTVGTRGAWATLQEKLSAVLDPAGVLSPGRYQ